MIIWSLVILCLFGQSEIQACTQYHIKIYRRKNQNRHKDLKSDYFGPSIFNVSLFRKCVLEHTVVKNPTIAASQKAVKPSRCISRLVTITSVWSPEGYYFWGWRVVGWIIVQSSPTRITDEKQRPGNRFNTRTFWYSEVYNLHWNRECCLLLEQTLEWSQCQETKRQE